MGEGSVCSILEHTAKDGKKYKTKFYNLDAIIAVGYRVNSKQATAFRIWATEMLRDYLLHGYVLNRKILIESKQNTLHDLEKTIGFIQNVITKKTLDQGEVAGILQVIREYAHSFALLDTYDKGGLVNVVTKNTPKVFSFMEARKNLDLLTSELMKRREASDLFAKDRNEHLEGILASLHQSFSGEMMYPSIELRAAHLLYFTIKDHPFFDGNKRSAAFLFIRYLDMHSRLRRRNGEKIITENTLTALALLIAESDPKEKEQMIALITQLLK